MIDELFRMLFLLCGLSLGVLLGLCMVSMLITALLRKMGFDI